MMDNFKQGYLIYSVKENLAVSELSDLIKSLTWDDGFIAFSQGEFRWQGKGFDTIDDLKTLLSVRHKGKGYEGYVMEADLWREDGGMLYEELSIERDSTGFFVQHWQLHTSIDTVGDRKAFNCYYRHTHKVIPLRQSKLFQKGELSAIEVVVPEFRLHIYLTTKRGK